MIEFATHNPVVSLLAFVVLVTTVGKVLRTLIKAINKADSDDD